MPRGGLCTCSDHSELREDNFGIDRCGHEPHLAAKILAFVHSVPHSADTVTVAETPAISSSSSFVLQPALPPAGPSENLPKSSGEGGWTKPPTPAEPQAPSLLERVLEATPPATPKAPPPSATPKAPPPATPKAAPPQAPLDVHLSPPPLPTCLGGQVM